MKMLPHSDEHAALQQQVDEAYREWKEAARNAPCGGTPFVEKLWKRFCKLDNKLSSLLGA